MKRYLTPVVDTVLTDNDLLTDLFGASKETDELGILDLDYDSFQ